MRFDVSVAAAEVMTPWESSVRPVLSSGPPNFMHTAEIKGVAKASTPILKQYCITWIIWMKLNFLCAPFSFTCCSYSEEVSWCQLKETFSRSGV